MTKKPLIRYILHCTILLCTGLAWPVYNAFDDDFENINIPIYEHRLEPVAAACHEYAEAHDKNFPDGKSSNEAFRKLFQTGLVEYEYHFHGYEPRGSDNIIGTAETGFREALEPGECTLYYVRGFQSDHYEAKRPWIFTLLKNEWRNTWVYISADYSIQGETVGPFITGTLDAEKVNLLSPDYWKQFGIDFNDVLAPEGPMEDPMVLSPTAQAHRRERWFIFIPYGLFLIADLGYACLAKRRRKSLPMKTAQ